MKILSLTLTNFLPILSGIGKESITVDLSNSNDLITVLIGKIGSGKTYILSHLQPFSTVGTLDVRNQDDPIVAGKNGYKEIVYEHASHIYRINHEFHWTGKTHTKKSFIEKDGVELNENGNRSSFETIVEMELGITVGLLRILRLGPNVINFIHMKTTERKAYIAALSQDTEIYLTLYKYWSRDLRDANAQASLLMTKLSQFGTKTTDEWKEDLEDLEEDMQDVKREIDELTKQKYELEAENKTWMGGLSYAEIKEKQLRLQKDIPQCKEDIERLSELIQSFEKYPEITEVSKEIGRMDQEMESLSSTIQNLEAEYESVYSQLMKLEEKKKLQASDTQMQSLRNTYDELYALDQKYSKELKGFKCEYSSAFLTSFLEDLNGINVLIGEVTQYDSDLVKKIFHSDSTVLSYASKQTEILGYRKLGLQKKINNLKFSEGYTPVTPLYRPPFCPTDTCPYFHTHPVQIQKDAGSKGESEALLEKYQQEIQEIDVSIYQYAEYPILYAKMVSLKKYWRKAIPVLKNIRALNCESLENVLTFAQYRVWYNYDRVVNTIDQLEKREKHFELTEQLKETKHELTELELLESGSIDSEIAVQTAKKENITSDIEEKEKRLSEVKGRLVDFNQMYLNLSEKGLHEEKLREEKEELKTMQKDLEYIENKDEQIQQNLIRIQSLDRKIVELQKSWNDLSGKQDSIRTRIHDITETSKELDKLVEEQKYLKYMTDAVSSKGGIPLKMIQIFLDSCREVVNDLIYDVCEEDLEILPFQISPSEFQIPYMVNGQRIDDISKASQGQTSVVSTALSFALVQKTESMFYNIPLLDEMDAPLHREYKQKFIAILLKHLKKIGSEQCFVITHDENTFDGYPVQVIMTTEEHVNREKYTNVIQL